MPFKNPQIRKERHKTYSQKYYAQHKEEVKAKAKLTNARGNLRNQLFVFEYLKDKKCELCPYNNPLGLTFDHRGDKRLEVSTMAKVGYGLETLKAEIAKCRILCFNCHMVEANRERNSLKWQFFTASREG